MVSKICSSSNKYGHKDKEQIIKRDINDKMINIKQRDSISGKITTKKYATIKQIN